jgi:nucleotide-binding universal stress UspA family protein
MDSVRQILVPIDGSPESEQSLVTVAELAGVTGAKVTRLHVVEPSPIPTWASEASASYELGQYVKPAEVDRSALTQARQYVDQLADRLTTQRISTEALAVLGDVPKTITDTALAASADLIVMRTRALTGAARAVLGSVADAVVRSSSTPVLLVRGQSSAAARATDQARFAVTTPAA